MERFLGKVVSDFQINWKSNLHILEQIIEMKNFLTVPVIYPDQSGPVSATQSIF